MAVDTRSITITLKLDKTGNEETDTTKQTSQSSGSDENDKGSTGRAIAIYAGMQVLSGAVNEGLAWAEYEWNKTLTLNDDYIGQRNKTIALTHINRTVSNISTIGSGIAGGAAVGGWVGAIIGGVISTIQVAAGIIRSNVQGQEQQDIHLKQMNGQLDFTRSRAGWSTQAASIGEDL